MSEDPEGKHEGIDSLSVAPKLPGTGNDRDAPRAPNPNPIQPTHDSVALSDISPATQPQVAEQHALVGSTPVSESAAVASQSLTAQVDVPPEFTRSCELTPGSASPSTQIPSELTAPNSEKPTDPAMSSTRGSDNTTSGWHGVHIIAWNSEFMEEDEPPPYEPRS
ncbi:hypothetical protein GY45DRAFT_1374547 [Cubamyces sp. BRFM 1775]|nr:hypothetical protein GY45DRAFT_1374547 [Cubamyces sp. BRFM 1775]